MIYPNHKFHGQEVSICNRYAELLRREHNEHPDGTLSLSLRGSLNDVMPSAYHAYRLIWLNMKWQDVLNGNPLLGFPGVPLDNRLEATNRKDEALTALGRFYTWERNSHRPTIARVFRDRHIAEQACKSDIRHGSPNAEHFKTNGLPSANPSTNMAYIMRLIHTDPNMSHEDRDSVLQAKSEIKNISSLDDWWDTRGIDLDSIRVIRDIPAPPDPPENFLTWTESPSSRFTIDATSVTGLNIARNESAFVYDNKGVDHFDDFDILIDVEITASNINGSVIQPIVLSNVIDDYGGIFDAAGDALALRFIDASGAHRIQVVETENGSFNSDFDIDWALNVPKYCRYIGSGSSLTNAAFSDVDRTVNTSNQSVTRAASTKFGIIQTCGSADFDDGKSEAMSGVCSNMDLQEPSAAFQAAWAKNSNQIIGARAAI